MTEKMESALSAYEWATLGPNGHGHPIMPSTVGDIENLCAEDLRKAVAVANFGLPDSDPRKITREKVAALRKLIGAMYGDETGGVLNGTYTSPAENRQLWSLADALESYLPPSPGNKT